MRLASGVIVIGSIAALFASFGVACSLAVSFDDQPSCDGGLCVDASVATDAAFALDAARPDAPSDAAPKDAAKDAPADVIDTSCKGLAAGMYCARDHLNGYLGAPSDLVNCDGGYVYAVRHCADAGCLAMPDPFPDTCNECPEKQNGTYCGRDFAGFPAANADILIGCQVGNAVQIYACPHGCKSAGNDASCY